MGIGVAGSLDLDLCAPRSVKKSEAPDGEFRGI